MGVCGSWVGRSVSRDFWRQGDKQRYRIPLPPTLAATLKGSGHDEETVEDHWGVFCRLLLATLAESFDFIEVYAGCARFSEAWVEAGFHALSPSEVKQGWDMIEQELFSGLVGLIRRSSMKFVWVAPPCTTFSLPRPAKLRSLEVPWGFEVCDPDTATGNLHGGQTLLLIESGGAFEGEQSAFGFMRAVAPWGELLTIGCFEVLFDWCRFGRPCHKTSRTVMNFEPLKKLELRCCHCVKHKALKERATTLAGAYSRPFSRWLVELSSEI